MRCPICKSDSDRVIDSRPWNNGFEVKRRRHCSNCNNNFNTFEKSETITLMVVKKDKRREPYSRDKVRKGLLIACKKRPISSEQIEGMIDDLEKIIYQKNSSEISSQELGEFLVMKLFEIDEVAYVRFASVYRHFRDVNQFMSELKGLLSKME
ncbi:MAG: transcriptional repressor NrdR [Candidatus Omnitrophica bacterium]|nr:transcriptional repressor NrdR [Candidatus Omnitrophota bacterium]